MKETDFFHTRIISNCSQDGKLIGSEKRCSLRHKKKILPGDKVSVQKNFPRFYEKCVNKRNCKKNETQAATKDDNLVTVDAILDRIESVTLEENSLLSVRYRTQATDSTPKVIYAHKKSPDLSRRTRYQLAKELEQELRKKVLRPVVSSPPDNSIQHQSLEEELLRKRLLRPLLSCPTWNSSPSTFEGTESLEKPNGKPLRPSSRIQLLASLIMGSAQGGCKAEQPPTHNTIKAKSISANHYNTYSQTVNNRSTTYSSVIKKPEIERTYSSNSIVVTNDSPNTAIKTPDDTNHNECQSMNGTPPNELDTKKSQTPIVNTEQESVNNSSAVESQKTSEENHDTKSDQIVSDTQVMNVEKIDRPSSLPDINSSNSRPMLCRSASEDPHARCPKNTDLEDLKAMAERLHLNTQPGNCQEWLAKVSSGDLTHPHLPTLVKVELIGEEPISDEEKRANAIAWLRKELVSIAFSDIVKNLLFCQGTSFKKKKKKHALF